MLVCKGELVLVLFEGVNFDFEYFFNLGSIEFDWFNFILYFVFGCG